MKCRVLLFACIAFTMTSCHPKLADTRSKVQSETAQPSEQMKKNPDSMQNEIGGKETCLGKIKVQGVLYHSKGRLAQLGGFILPNSFFTGPNGGNWKPEFEAMVGKKVEAEGVHYRYRCGPIEQCLEGGVINYLREITSLQEIK